MFHQLRVELCNSNEELSTFVENFKYTIKKYENSIFQFIGKRSNRNNENSFWAML